jgi:hypothetical protein
MTFARKAFRSGLLLAGVTAIAVVIVALREQGGRTPEAWATLAAALAVLASLVSAFSSQRVVELQEDALQPALQASFDFRNRYELAQFRVANRGASAAYDVRIEWDKPPLQTVEGLPVQIFGPSGILPILLPGDEASFLLGQSHAFLSAHLETKWSGTFTYHNAATARRDMRFTLTAEHERLSLVHNEEDPKTQFELQKIPGRLKDIATELSRMRRFQIHQQRSGPAKDEPSHSDTD